MTSPDRGRRPDPEGSPGAERRGDPEWPQDAVTRVSRWVLRVASAFVPAGGRRACRDEWEGELWQLRRERNGPGPLLAFLVGALWHGLWEWKEGWRMDSVVQDIRFALRTLARSPGFTAAAVLMLASSIGAGTALFSVLDQAVLADPPFPDPDRLVVVDNLAGRSSEELNPALWAYPRFAALRESTPDLEQVAGYARRTMTLTDLGDPAVVSVEAVTPSFFPLLGAEAERGRLLGPEEEDHGAPALSAVVSHAFWTTRMGGVPDAVGSFVTLDQVRLRVVGVAAESFQGVTGGTEVWVPMSSLREIGDDSFLDDPWNWHFSVLARLRPGVPLDAARAQVQAFGATLKERFPAPVGASQLVFGADLVPYREARANPVARASLLALFSSVLLLLLVAAANLAGLLLARGSTRRREAAVRTSLGAARSRILRQLLTESLVLAVVGGALGVLLAVWGVDALGAWLAEALGTTGGRGLQYFDPTALSVRWPMLVFATLLTAGVGLGVGILPAWQAAGADPNRTLRGGHAGEAPRSWLPGIPGRQALIVVQVAVALVLVAGATVMVRSLSGLQQMSLGFTPEHLLTASYALAPEDRSLPSEEVALHTTFVDRLRSLPGVEGATVGSVPMGGPVWRAIVMSSEGRPDLTPQMHTWVRIQPVADGHLGVMGIRLSEGRDIERQDDERSEAVIILGETAARVLFPDGHAVGRRVSLSWPELGMGARVVGVAEDVVYDEPGAPPGLQAYVSVRQAPRGETGVLIRTSGDPEALLPSVRDLLAELSPNTVLTSAEPMRARLAGVTARARVVALLLTLFGGVSLFLVAAGLYGTVAFVVAQRTRELGLRASLGAPQPTLLRLVLRQGLATTAVGLVVGLCAAGWCMRFLKGLVFGADVIDGLTLACACAALIVVAGVAAYVPARRALRIDPMVALRSD